MLNSMIGLFSVILILLDFKNHIRQYVLRYFGDENKIKIKFI